MPPLQSLLSEDLRGKHSRHCRSARPATSTHHISLSNQSHSLAGSSRACIRADQGRLGYFGARKLGFVTARPIARGIRYAFPLHCRISRISPVHASGSADQQSAAEVGCENDIGAAFGTIDSADCCGSKARSPSFRRSHPLPLYDGQSYRHALRVRT